MTYQDVRHHYEDPPDEWERVSQARSDAAKAAPRCARTGKFLPWSTPVQTDDEQGGREYLECPDHGWEPH